ncbi:MAG: hypothetical protein WDW36_001554 [Sanguina aurantia]
MWHSGTGNIIPASILRWMTDLRWQLAAPIYRHVENMSEQLVAESVEGSFDAEEFVDGAKSAVENFYTEIAEGSEGLQPMASSMLVDRMALDALEMQAVHGLQLESATADIHHATVISSNLWSAESVARFHPAALDDVNVNTSRSWLVVSLKMDLSLHTLYKIVDKPVPSDSELDALSNVTGGHKSEVATPAEGEPVAAAPAVAAADRVLGSSKQSSGKQSSGKQAVRLPPRTLNRQGTWLFARGPLPKGHTGNLHLPWRVLSWW